MTSKSIDAFLGRVTRSVALVSVACTLVLTLIVTAEVVLRYGFNSPTSWVVEMSQYLMLYLVFAGFAYTLYLDKHVNADLVITHLPRRVRDWLKLLSGVIILFVSAILMWKTGELARITLVESWHSTTQLRTLLFPVYVAMPLGSFLLTIVSVFKLYGYGRAVLTGSKAADVK